MQETLSPVSQLFMGCPITWCLALSYDVVKAHRGEIKVETREGIGSSFIILLPVA